MEFWNGVATYYRGIVKALYNMVDHITFYKLDIYERQSHRDIEDPDYCEVIVYEKDKVNLRALLRKAQEESDIIIKTSGVGSFDAFLEEEIPTLKKKDNTVIFWDGDASEAIERIEENPVDAFRNHVAKYDCILTYGGGEPVQHLTDKSSFLKVLNHHTHRHRAKLLDKILRNFR